MQNIGSTVRKSEEAAALEREIAKEKAAALGIAGSKLQQSIDEFRRSTSRSDMAPREEQQLADIAANVWALLVHRESLGLAHDNLKWLREHYDIPEAALRRLGLGSRFD